MKFRGSTRVFVDGLWVIYYDWLVRASVLIREIRTKTGKRINVHWMENCRVFFHIIHSQGSTDCQVRRPTGPTWSENFKFFWSGLRSSNFACIWSRPEMNGHDFGHEFVSVSESASDTVTRFVETSDTSSDTHTSKNLGHGFRLGNDSRKWTVRRKWTIPG